MATEGSVGDLEQAEGLARVRNQVLSVMVGKADALDQLLIALLCRGHVLIEDVPGVGKTVLAKSLAAALGCTFRRIQFTPDVLPSDITGSSIYNQRSTEFEFRPGPLFTHILLADEINRATPRAQSAMLEAMQEFQVTCDGVMTELPQPFFVLATQNPIELEGTFPLPEAQLDRFLLRVPLGYPTLDEEHEVLRRFEGHDPLRDVQPVVSAQEILQWQELRSRILVSRDVADYLLAIVRATRSHDHVALGASPRAALALFRTTQARALLLGRTYVIPDDVKALAVAVLAHRMVLTAQARLRGSSADATIGAIIDSLVVPVEEPEPAVESR